MEEMRRLIQTNDKHTIGALIALCPVDPFEDEGFNSYQDFHILNDVANFYLKRGYLSTKQIAMIRPKLIKYVNLINRKGYEPVSENKFTVKKYFNITKKKDAIYVNDQIIKLSFTYDKELIVKIKTINGREFIADDKTWNVPLTDSNIDKIDEWGFKIDERILDWKNKQSNPVDDSDIFIPALDSILRPFQKTGISFIEKMNGRALVADDMGLGKTIQSIGWIEYHKEDDIYPVLVVCPAAVKINWVNELQKFVKRKDVEIVYGKKPYPTRQKIVIINYDILQYWQNELIGVTKPKTIIFDEIHKLKGDTKRTKAAAKISKNTRYVIGLSGTPMLNRPAELYNPIKIIKPNLFPNKKSFLYRYCDPKFNGFAMTYTGAKNTQELHDILIKEVMIRRKKTEVLPELPGKMPSLLPFEITNRKEYNHALTDLIGFLREIDPERAKRAERAKAFALMATLKKLAVEGKINQVIDWIADAAEEEKIVVFAHHKDVVDRVYQAFQKTSVKYVGGMTDKQRNQAETDFREKENVKIFIGNIEAAGTGINLQVSSNIVFIEYPWSPGLYSQATDRCDRIGQKYLVNVYNTIAVNTVEEKKISILEEKAKTISAVIDGDETEQNGIFNELMLYFKNYEVPK